MESAGAMMNKWIAGACSTTSCEIERVFFISSRLIDEIITPIEAVVCRLLCSVGHFARSEKRSFKCRRIVPVAATVALDLSFHV